MDFLSDPAATEPPLTKAGQAALRDHVLAGLADFEDLPIPPDAQFTRALWLVLICRWGAQTRAVIPIDNRLDRPEPDAITGWCDLLAGFLDHPIDDETALIVLRRPEPADISDADEYICRVMCEAAAGRAAMPWDFYVAGPGSVRQLTERATVPLRP